MAAELAEVADFLYHEAGLLEDGRFEDWLALFSHDCRYWIPLDEQVQHIEGTVRERGLPLMDEDWDGLAQRVKWIASMRPHVESPASQTQRLITNVRIRGRDDLGLLVSSSFLVHQIRSDGQAVQHIGRRRDALRPQPGGSFRIGRREVRLLEPILHRSLSLFL